MSHDLYVAMSGAMSRMNELDLIANNIANSDTAGFKRLQSVFSATLEERIRDVDGNLTAGVAGRVHSSQSTPAIDLAKGGIRHTGNPLHVAIQGDGFFQIETPEGARFTRAGDFSVGAEGFLATPAGYAVTGDGGPIEVGARSAQITATGVVLDGAGDELGRLSLVQFADPTALKHAGGSLFRTEAGTEPEAVDELELAERSLESSNVKPVEEMASMVMVQRVFEISMRTMQAEDQSTQRLLREISS